MLVSVSVWIREEAVDGWHDLRALVAHKLPQAMLWVFLTLCKVIKHSCGSVFFGYPEIKIKFTYYRGQTSRLIFLEFSSLFRLHWYFSNLVHCNASFNNLIRIDLTWRFQPLKISTFFTLGYLEMREHGDRKILHTRIVLIFLRDLILYISKVQTGK